MALLFELLFYAGLLTVVFALVWGFASVVRGCWSKLAMPGVLLGVGIALLVTPAYLSRRIEVDLGPRDVMVDGERHVTLTGWNGDGYEFLSQQNDIVVLQMGNADVTDQTLKSISAMNRLRELDLNETQISDDGVRMLAQLPSLRTVRLRGTSVTDSGIQSLLDPSSGIRQLDVRETMVTQEVIEQWKSLGDDRRALQ